ncbi:hypothetical protein GIB67_004684 [Kingdonia uniflora]|uniref:Aminotransferase-like plant mobile domain-containing protein n=1 Tax=Kingdonia uniflora TaxID=39325 RepID=A0A7J7P575_9MAGN|nr:hypothetical protein GIB67_004684 [Kingdonia uniflora]
MNEKVSPTASNRRKRELAREEDLLIYKRKRNTIDSSTIVPPNTDETANKGVSEPVPSIESAQATLGAQAESAHAVIFPRVQNLILNLNTFKSLKAGGTGNSFSLRKLKEHYAYKLEKVLSDGAVAATKKKKGLTARSAARAYMLYVLGSFLFPTKKGTDISAWYIYLFTKVAKKWSWGSAILAHMYYNLGTTSPNNMSCAYAKIVEMNMHHEHASLSPNAHDTMPTRGGSGGLDQQITELNDQLQKLKKDKEKEFEANTKLREALKEKTSECNLLKETIEQMKEDYQLKCVVDKQCALEFADLLRLLDVKLVVLQSHQLMPDVTLAKKYDDLLSAHEDVKKKLIAKEDFCKKLVNAEERMKSLEVNNSEWFLLEEVWRHALKKALTSEGMGAMGDPTFEELFEQNERFFTIAQ